MNDEVMVSIWCVTYNHEEFIRGAFDGFLNQKTSFRFQICIFDDASTDHTPDIIREYMVRYPETIIAELCKTNTFGSPNRKSFTRLFYNRAVLGKYVAWCEGDDCWTDENKLQIQVDFLEQNPECMMHTHAAERIDCRTGKRDLIRPCEKSGYCMPSDVIVKPLGNFPSASIMARNNIFKVDDEEFPKADVGDIRRQMYALSKGKIYYLDKPMSLYRYMHSGSWSARTENSYEKFVKHSLIMVGFFCEYDEYTGYKYSRDVKRCIMRYLYNLINYDIDDASRYGIWNDEKNKEDATRGIIFDELKRICRLMKESDATLCDDDRLKMTEYSHVIIFGTGNYSSIIDRLLKNSGINADGYFVSKKSVDESRSNVWDLNSFPYDPSETVLIYGVNQELQDEVEPVVNKMGFGATIAPLWFRIEGLY